MYFIVLISLLPVFGLAVPAGSRTRPGTYTAQNRNGGDAAKPASSMPFGNTNSCEDVAAPEPNTEVSMTQMANAVMSWMKDTGKVTRFVNKATSFVGDEFTLQATIALNAENDELNHKMVLDAAIGQMPEVAAANDVLNTQGKFQMVVDIPQRMVDRGPDTAQADVDAINMNRCVNVLPTIDKYFAAAGLPKIQAVRPTGSLCRRMGST